MVSARKKIAINNISSEKLTETDYDNEKPIPKKTAATKKRKAGAGAKSKGATKRKPAKRKTKKTISPKKTIKIESKKEEKDRVLETKQEIKLKVEPTEEDVAQADLKLGEKQQLSITKPIVTKEWNIVKLQIDKEIADEVKASSHEEEAEEDNLVKELQPTKTRSISLYRRIALSFIVLTIVLLAVIGYFTFVKVDISLVPNQERISNNLIFDVYDEDSQIIESRNTLSGVVKNVKINISESYKSTGAEVIGEETVGTVTVINNYNKNQPLVATTRLLSPDNKLYRINETINVPAGGSVEVEVYADIPGEDKAIAPATFTIPGLWAGLQDKIFAKSTESFAYQQKKKMFIKEDDIENSIRELKQKLLTKAKDEVNEMYKDFDQIIYSVDENSINYVVDGKAGDEKEDFKIDMNANVIVVAFNEDRAIELAQQKFLTSLADNKELISFDKNDILFSLHEYDINQGIASVNATFEGKVSIKENAQIVEVDKILGLNEKQLEAYLAGLPEIAGYEITFFPSFIKKVPSLVDRVNIVIKK